MKWKQIWRKLVERGEVKEEVLELWSKAVKELRSSNGLKLANSEYKYKFAVVDEICKLLPRRLKCSTDGIQGYVYGVFEILNGLLFCMVSPES